MRFLRDRVKKLNTQPRSLSPLLQLADIGKSF
ncbi:hypothetical protein, partial [Cronobacter sakazakii]